VTAAACGACGTALVEQARFCAACGRRVHTDSAPRAQYMTVLICDLANSMELTQALGDEAMFHLINRFQATCTDAVVEHGGIVAKFMGDGMLAYFGYPEPVKNSPAAAVQAAHEIVAATPKIAEKLSASAGVATGWTVVAEGTARGPATETLAIGRTVNLASRLQSAAGHGRIVVSEETRRRLDPARFKLLPVGRRTLKGMDSPTELWSAEPTPTASVSKRFVGREAALARLGEIWGAARNDGLRLCEIVAPGGHGKTALAYHARAIDESHRLELRAERHQRMQSFAPFRTLVREILDLGHAIQPEEQRARLKDVLPPELREAMSDLLGLSHSPAPPAIRQPRIAAALTAFLQQQIGTTPTILLLEDTHWMDPDTAAFLPRLARALADRPALLLATRRTGAGGLPAGASRLELDPLGPEESHRLLDLMDPDGQIPPGARRGMARATGTGWSLRRLRERVPHASVPRSFSPGAG